MGEERQHREQVGLLKEGAGGEELLDGYKRDAQHVAWLGLGLGLGLGMRST